MGSWEQLKENASWYEAGAFDVAVIGAGHAGCEAAFACAHLGLSTVLFTLHLDQLANLPCNPSIGGTAKGQLVREIDALGGVMGEMADLSAIQTRMLNRSKGPAVFSPRAQMDRAAYSRRMKERIENEENISLIQGEVVELFWEDGEKKKILNGVRTRSGACYHVKAAVICSGTYMEARTIRGEVIVESGPDGLSRSVGLSESMAQAGITMQRFKTGTPVRVNSRTVDTSVMEIQPGEPDMPPFSFGNEMAGKVPPKEQIPCYAVWTTEETRKVITENMDRSPLYSGVIEGIGPRYCPSIEDKFMRFPDKSRHQIFVEPMGEETRELYLQGFSTSLPEDVQVQMVHSLPGLEKAHIQRAAYAIEYDCIDPTTADLSLESTLVSGLFTAGQINGSSGYEEAAAQGLMAGINAAMKVLGREPVILDRSQAYIGVLIDDLVTKGTKEPYRMMTSRAEYRLILRQDNADLRLTEYGRRVGLVTDERYARYQKKKAEIEAVLKTLRETTLTPSAETNEKLAAAGMGEIRTVTSLFDLLRRPEADYRKARALFDLPEVSDEAARQIDITVRYEGYIRRQQEQIDRMERLESKLLPPDMDYEKVPSLREEAREKLIAVRPRSVGQAGRISGVSPADVSVLLVWLEKERRSQKDS